MVCYMVCGWGVVFYFFLFLVGVLVEEVMRGGIDLLVEKEEGGIRWIGRRKEGKRAGEL